MNYLSLSILSGVEKIYQVNSAFEGTLCFARFWIIHILYPSSKVKQLFTTMHRCSSIDKLHPQNLFRNIYWRSSIQHWLNSTRTLHPAEGTWEKCPMCVKKESSFASSAYEWSNFRSRLIKLIPLDGTVLAYFSMKLLDSFKYSLQSAGSLQSIQTAWKFQRYPQKWSSTVSAIWQIIIDFLKSLFDFIWWNYESKHNFYFLKVA